MPTSSVAQGVGKLAASMALPIPVFALQCFAESRCRSTAPWLNRKVGSIRSQLLVLRVQDVVRDREMTDGEPHANHNCEPIPGRSLCLRATTSSHATLLERIAWQRRDVRDGTKNQTSSRLRAIWLSLTLQDTRAPARFPLDHGCQGTAATRAI